LIKETGEVTASKSPEELS